MHDDVPSLDVYSPTPHATQVDSPSEPVTNPAEQLEQVDIAVSFWYCPAGHAVHTVALANEKYPTEQFKQELASSKLEYRPASQAMHSVCPTPPAYWPAKQSVHLLERSDEA